jgi:cytochrome c-type biogenesis protein
MLIGRKSLIIMIITVVLVVLSIGVVRYGWFLPDGGLSGLLSTGQNGGLIPYLVVISALVDSVNPCAFSVLLLTIAFFFSLGKTRRKILEAGGLYIFGIFLTYLLIGLGITQVLAVFGVPHFMAKIGAGVVIVWAAIDLLGEFIPNFSIQLKIPQGAHRRIAQLIERGTIPTALALGVLVGLTEFPCTGGPYLFILGLLHDTATFSAGLWYLILYNLIFVAPLVVILIVGSDQALLGRVQEWKKANNHAFRVWMGVIMLALGVLILQF